MKCSRKKLRKIKYGTKCYYDPSWQNLSINIKEYILWSSAEQRMCSLACLSRWGWDLCFIHVDIVKVEARPWFSTVLGMATADDTPSNSYISSLSRPSSTDKVLVHSPLFNNSTLSLLAPAVKKAKISCSRNYQRILVLLKQGQFNYICCILLLIEIKSVYLYFWVLQLPWIDIVSRKVRKMAWHWINETWGHNYCLRCRFLGIFPP